jgi:prepilin-type N-terminal cleavage/methylation domain-containing protein
MYTFHKKNEGYSLVEVLVAIAILLLALVGPMTIAAKGIQSARYAKEQTTAIFLAQEGIEAFLSARNSAAIEAVNNGDISTSWDWVSGIDASCFAATGCNIDFATDDPLGTVQSCAREENCRLYYDESDTRARYSLSSSGGTQSQYIRKIVLVYDSTPGNKGVQIESTVSWSASLFSDQVQDVTLSSAMFSIYE